MDRRPSRVDRPNETYFRAVGLFYHYEPLNYKVKCIRLVRILPGAPEDDLRLEIKTVPLITKSYICLSYCWASPSRNPILLNGRLASVRDNLDAFLRQARASHIEAWMWIDSLCIDQENHSERNHQVRQMAQIYSGARHVIMWLGISDTSYPSLQSSSYRNWDSMHQTLDTIKEIMPRCSSSFSYVRRKMGQQTPALWSCLICLRDNEYWSRLWITPEVILAKRAIVWCRDLEFSWKPLAILMKLAWGDAKGCPSYLTTSAWELGPPCVATLTDLYRPHQEDEPHIPLFYLHTVLSFVDSLKCEDPRDRVYGMLSLAADGHEIPINYDRSLLSLFLQLRAHWTSLVSQGFDVLWAGSCTHLANQLGVTAYALEAHILGLRKTWYWKPASLLYTKPGQELCYRHRKGSDTQEYRVYSLESHDSHKDMQQDAAHAHDVDRSFTRLCSDCQKYADDTCGTLSIIRSKRLKIYLGSGLAPEDPGPDSGIQVIRQRLGVYQPQTSNTEVALEESVSRNLKPIFLLISEQTRYSHAFILPQCQKQVCAQRKWVGLARPAFPISWSDRLNDEGFTTLSTPTVASKNDRSLPKERRLRVPGQRILMKSLAIISA